MFEISSRGDWPGALIVLTKYPIRFDMFDMGGLNPFGQGVRPEAPTDFA